MRAATSGHTLVVETLVAANADVNACTDVSTAHMDLNVCAPKGTIWFIDGSHGSDGRCDEGPHFHCAHPVGGRSAAQHGRQG
jgi:hypothetical protein